MKKKVVKFVGILTALVLLLPGGTISATETAQEQGQPLAESELQSQMIRIGLSYGSSAAVGANLLNRVGKGYRLGYYDDSLGFHTLAVTGETLISVVKTQNVYYFPASGNKLQRYTDAEQSDIAVGCFHIQLPGGYATYEEAQAAAAGVQGGFLAWIGGTYYVRLGAYLDGDSARNALAQLGIEGASVEGTSAYGVSVVKTGTSQILFQFDGDDQMSLGIEPGQGNGERTETWYAGSPYFGGFRFERINGGNLTVVNIVELENYVNCVISREMSDSWPLEALKAQACSARTYAARYLNRHGSHHFDMCPSTHCQAYPGCGSIGLNTTQAAQETAGLHIWYGGRLAETFYYSSNGGASENSENVWVSAVPYLKGKVDPFEALVADQIPKYNWSVTYSKEQLTSIVRASGRNCGEIVNLYVSETTPTGNVRSITFLDDAGKRWTFYGSSMNDKLGIGLRSYRFTIYGGGMFFVDGTENVLDGMNGVYAIGGDGDIREINTPNGMPYVMTASGVEQLYEDSETYTIVGTGWGHNVGMSQYGALAMAKQGYTYQDILKFYYTGVEIR